MKGMMVSSSDKLVSRDDLDLIPLPEETASYKPVSHYALAGSLLTISRDILTDYILVGEQYCLARNGNQMFLVLNFERKNDRGELGLSFCARNSYDRSMSLGFSCGANAWVCSNLALQGQIVVLKKHTPKIWDSLENDAITTMYRANQSFMRITEDAGKMKSIGLGDNDAFRLMGLLFGKDIVSPRQLTVLKEEWLRPSYADYQARNLWSLYNGATHALKTCPPISAMEKRVQLHDIIEAQFCS